MGKYKCIGCKSWKYFNSFRKKEKHECIYTPLGFISIPNCPCPQCLLKSVCENAFCEEFNKQLENFRSRFDKPLWRISLPLLLNGVYWGIKREIIGTFRDIFNINK